MSRFYFLILLLHLYIGARLAPDLPYPLVTAVLLAAWLVASAILMPRVLVAFRAHVPARRDDHRAAPCARERAAPMALVDGARRSAARGALHAGRVLQRAPARARACSRRTDRGSARRAGGLHHRADQRS